MGLCSLQHGLKDQGKDGVCLLSPCAYLCGWSSDWYCPDQGARTYVRSNGSSWLERLRLSTFRALSRPCLWNGETRTGAGPPHPPWCSKHCRIHPKAVQNTREDQREWGKNSKWSLSLEQRPPGETESSVPVLPSFKGTVVTPHLSQDPSSVFQLQLS